VRREINVAFGMLVTRWEIGDLISSPCASKTSQCFSHRTGLVQAGQLLPSDKPVAVHRAPNTDFADANEGGVRPRRQVFNEPI
jgi:hypothetical protein